MSAINSQLAALSPWRMDLRATLFPNAVRPTASRGLFERFILCTLMANMIIVALYDVEEHAKRSTWARVLVILDTVCTGIYLVEFFLRCLTFGVPHQLHPLRLVDTLGIIGNVAMVTLFFTNSTTTYVSINTLRTVRVVRPFFTTLRFPSVRILVSSVLRSVFHLADVVLLYILFLMWFAAAGVNQFGGGMGTRCVNEGFWSVQHVLNITGASAQYYPTDKVSHTFFFVPEENFTVSVDEFVCGAEPSAAFMSKFAVELARINFTAQSLQEAFCTPMQTCLETPTWFVGGYRCPYNFRCVNLGHNPYFDLVGFDNFFLAALTCFTSVTFQLWYEVMFWTSDAENMFSYPFFVGCVVLGAYLIINLTIVIITVEFEKGKEHERRRIKELQADLKRETKPSLASVVQELLVASKQKQLDATELKRPDLHPGMVVTDNEQDDLLGGTPLAKTSSAATNQRSEAPETISSPLLGEGIEEEMSRIDAAATDEHGSLQLKVAAEPDDDAHDEERYNERQSEKKNTRKIPPLDPNAPAYLKLRHFLHYYVVETRAFSYLAILMIVGNLVALGYVHYGMSQQAGKVLDYLNIGFTIFFTVEALLRFLSMIPSRYIRDFHNVADVVIVVASWVEILVPAFDFPFIRGLRAVRCVKLLKEYPALYNWILFVASATKTSPLLLLLLSLMVFIFGCMGMQIFGGTFCYLVDPEAHQDLLLHPNGSSVTRQDWYDFGNNISGPVFANGTLAPGFELNLCPEETIPRANFDSFYQSMITAFQIITADDWNFVMYDAMRARGILWAIPFTVYFYLGNYVLVSLLIAVLLSAHSDNDEEPEETTTSQKTAGGGTVEEVQREQLQAAISAFDGAKKDAENKKKHGNSPVGNVPTPPLSDDDDDDEKEENRDAEFLDFDISDIQNKKKKKKKGKTRNQKRKIVIDDFAAQYTNRSAFSIKFEQGKAVAQRLIEAPWFQWGFSLALLVSGVAMALEDPIAAPDTRIVFILWVVDCVVTGLYLLHVMLAIYAYGLFRGGNSFLRRDGWNILDLVLLAISIMGCLLPFAKQTAVVRALSALRALRPMRIIRPSLGMNLVLSSLALSCYEMKHIMAISMMTFGMWGILGVFLFQGSLRQCLICS